MWPKERRGGVSAGVGTSQRALILIFAISLTIVLNCLSVKIRYDIHNNIVKVVTIQLSEPHNDDLSAM